MSTRENLKPVDFSDGIRDDEINEHFDSVNGQLRRERLYVAGSGVMSGLQFSTLKFKLNISSGSVIDLNGDEVFFDDSSYNIEPPKLIQKTEIVRVNDNGEASLSYVPYASTRLTPSEFDRVNSNLAITDADNITRAIKPLAVIGNKLTFDAKTNANRNVSVTYTYTMKRYDLIYIDNNYDIKILQGLTSSSPSVPMPKSTVVGSTTVPGYKYILGYILVDPMYSDPTSGNVGDKNPHAAIIVTKEYKNLRNIYTDADNSLYICGTPFKDLQIIHMDRPIDPVKENTMWYDSTYNKLRIYKTVDGISDWHVINDVSIVPVMEYMIWNHDELDELTKLPAPDTHDLQTFKFSQHGDEEALRMKFVPGKNELEVIIDNVPLMHDQYTEIVDNNPNGMYENMGIGFKLVNQLDHAADIEARVVHRVWEDPVYTRFQRSATFIDTDSFDYIASNGLAFATKYPYRLGENQLEVFVDGQRCDVDKDYFEGTDLDLVDRIKGTMSSEFTFNNLPATAKKISYKITTNVYSYDHIDDMLGGLSDRITEAEDAANKASSDVNSIKSSITDMQNTVDSVTKAMPDLSTYVKNTDVLTVSNMPSEVRDFVPSGIINKTVQYSAAGGSLNIKLTSVISHSIITDDISPTDYVQVFDISSSGGNKILRRRDSSGAAYDYDIISQNGSVYLSLANNNIVQDGHLLYITGIKLGISESNVGVS